MEGPSIWNRILLGAADLGGTEGEFTGPLCQKREPFEGTQNEKTSQNNKQSLYQKR